MIEEHVAHSVADAQPITDGPFCGRNCPCQTVTEGIRCTAHGEAPLGFHEIECKMLRCQECLEARQ